MYLNNFLSQNQNNRWGFFCILLYGLLVGFQGFDLCDEGWTMTAYQQIFICPQSVEYNFLYYVLTRDRKTLYERIDKRVDIMIANGLVKEIEKLKAMGCHRGQTSMQGLGYKEILDYLDGKTTLEEAIYIIKRETRHFAKRQLTWFRRERDVIWLDKQAYDYQDAKILEDMITILKEKTIIN